MIRKSKSDNQAGIFAGKGIQKKSYDHFVPCYILPETIENYLFRISVKSQAIYLLTAFILISVLIALPFIYVDVSFSSPGMITTMLENQAIFSPSNGKVVYSRVRSDQRVNAGDTLLILDTSVVEARKHHLHQRARENQQYVSDLKMLIQVDGFSVMDRPPNLVNPKYVASYQRFVRQYIQHHLEVERKRANHKRIEQLFLNQAISSSDYETSLYQKEQALAGLRFLLANQLNAWQSELTGILAEQARLEVDLSELILEKKRNFLISPLNGMIILSNDVQAGTFLYLSQYLGELSPEDHLIITTRVEPVNAGLLTIGQKVNVMTDAFNYQQWGMLNAVVMDISDDAIIDPGSNRPYYRVRCHLSADTLVNRNGLTAKLKKGMTVNCRFFLSRESLFTLVFRRIDHWMNPSNPPKEK